MTWDAIGALGEIIGAIAVLASLLYLALQIRHASNQFRAQQEENATTKIFEAYDPIYEGRNAEVMFTGLFQPKDLNAVDGFVFNLLMWRHASVFSNVATKIQKNEIEEAWAEYILDHYRKVLFDTPGGRIFLKDNPEAFGAGFDRLKGLIDDA